MKPDPDQLDFFAAPLFPVREAAQSIDLERFRARVKRAMARAIRECPYDRPTIAARMALYLGLASISKATLDAYTQLTMLTSRRNKPKRHTISVQLNDYKTQAN